MTVNPKSPSFRLQLFLCSGLWLTLGFANRLAARAGGAGGHSSGGSHSSGGGGWHSSSSGGSSSYHSSGGSSDSNGSSAFVVIFIIIVLIFIGISIYQNFFQSRIPPSPTTAPEPETESASLTQFRYDHPDFDIDLFHEKVGAAFLKIQAAWSSQSLATVRPFISDGIYQRFATQFRMMGLLRQQNPLDQIEIHTIQAVSARADGPYQVIDVFIQASVHDAFTCALDSSLDTEADETFVEYWSFIRKHGAGKGGSDIYQKNNCPSCGADLPQDMGELCQCSYCKVMVNSGEFDWVLAEITQEPDYQNHARMARLISPNLPAQIAAILPECPDFSTQLAEDKASNAFMQMMTAIATRSPASVRRFVTDEVFASVSAMIPDHDVVFNRIYLNESTLLHAARNGPRHRIDIRLSASMQRVELTPDQRIEPIDDEEIRSSHILIMERDANAVSDQGSLYQHQCATCGGRVGDTLDVNCQYCGTPLNSTHNEWIVTGFMDTAQYAGNSPQWDQ